MSSLHETFVQDVPAPVDELSVRREASTAGTSLGIGNDRDRIADDRDERAEAHDEASQVRDDRARARDERAEVRELAADGVDTGAAADRAGASRDRRGSASDRTQAADDREAAASDRHLSAQERTISSIDELTGAYARDAGTLELKREMARAKRTQQSLVLAFVDVDDLKETNDSLGHVAGDRLLREAVESIRANLRSYDLIVRFGGDEFVCALIDVSMSQTAERFAAVNAKLEELDASLTVGLAEMRTGDSLADLVERADEALYVSRGLRPSRR
ncbi:MAG TPA: GGDEF domain-containing protein [Actinomycetota bacterium]|nr:GGDEF domain-containing protein [Actinomycetota bacterium]